MVVGPGWVTVVPTRICITCVSGGAGVDYRRSAVCGSHHQRLAGERR